MQYVDCKWLLAVDGFEAPLCEAIFCFWLAALFSISFEERLNRACNFAIAYGCQRFGCTSTGCAPHTSHLKTVVYDSPPPPMTATVSKPVPRLFFVIFFFVLMRPVHVNHIVNSSPFFTIWPPVTVNILHFLRSWQSTIWGGDRNGMRCCAE